MVCGGGGGRGFVGQDAVCRSSASGCYLFASERQRLCVCVWNIRVSSPCALRELVVERLLSLVCARACAAVVAFSQGTKCRLGRIALQSVSESIVLV